MPLSFYALPAVGISLQGLLIWRLWRCRLIELYPYFTAVVIYDTCNSLLLLALILFWRNAYGWAYWTTEVIAVFLRFLVIWEAVRTLFPRESTLRYVAWKFLVAVELLVLPAILALWWRQSLLLHFPHRFVPPIFEQYVSLIQALLLLTVAMVARYYGVPLGKNMRGLIIGFGLYLTLCALNFASFQIISGFLPFWQLLSSWNYVGLTALWLWAFWQGDPVSEQGLRHQDYLDSKAQWNQLWTTTLGVVRRRSN